MKVILPASVLLRGRPLTAVDQIFSRAPMPREDSRLRPSGQLQAHGGGAALRWTAEGGRPYQEIVAVSR